MNRRSFLVGLLCTPLASVADKLGFAKQPEVSIFKQVQHLPAFASVTAVDPYLQTGDAEQYLVSLMDYYSIPWDEHPSNKWFQHIMGEYETAKRLTFRQVGNPQS